MDLDKRISKIDKNNIFSELKAFPDQIDKILNTFPQKNKIEKNNYSNILICGMGGSAIGGDFIKSLVGDEIALPLDINRDYNLPTWVSNASLIILSSYSGNTEEVVSCLNQCITKKINPIIITSNGVLLDQAKKNNFIYFDIPTGHMPRFAVGYSISILLLIFSKLGLISKTIEEKLAKLPELLQLDSHSYSSLDEANNKCIDMAKNIYDKFNIIYSSSNMEVLGLRFRAQLAENAKILSTHYIFPEQNHNEIEAFKNIHINNINIIWIKDKSDHKMILKRMDITANLLNDVVTNYYIESNGENILNRVFKNLYFIDWVSYYCAILNNTNPYPVDMIAKLKKML